MSRVGALGLNPGRVTALRPWERRFTPISTPLDKSINRGLVCYACIPTYTDFKDPDTHVLDGLVPVTRTHPAK